MKEALSCVFPSFPLVDTTTIQCNIIDKSIHLVSDSHSIVFKQWQIFHDQLRRFSHLPYCSGSLISEILSQQKSRDSECIRNMY